EIQTLQQQVDALQSQVQALQSQIDKLKSNDSAAQNATNQQSGKSAESQQAGTSSDAGKELKTGEAVNKATAEYETTSQDQEVAARLDNAPLDPKYPNYFRLPGTRTFMRIGGYAKSDLTFDPRPAGDQERFIPASIPIPTPTANVSN